MSTVKINVNYLADTALDWAVHTAQGLSEEEFVVMDNLYGPQWQGPEYSTSWQEGGPIIEREGIELLCESLGFRWVAVPQKGPEWRGPTPLIAAMRCYVASKLGDIVEVPRELYKEEN